ncbi:MAG: beta-galactosidase [Bacteroidota bacterium]
MKRLIYLLFFSLFILPPFLRSQATHSFEIKGGNFLLDHKPFVIHSGEMHFARIPKEYWRHRLKMAKAMGLNTIATYVFWNYHETQPGVWDYQSENRNIAEFLKTAQEEGLWVILRPGPYACAEWEFGGLPWFLQKEPNLVVRANNSEFLSHTKSYFNALAGQVKDLQITRGGPVIMAQIENEYGSYGNEMAYKMAIKKQMQDAGFDVPLYTSDGDWLFDKGAIPGVLPTANGEDNVDTLKARISRYNNGTGPYMVAEFYPGWLDHWGEPFEKVTKLEVADQLSKYLRSGVSFNLYMFHGGTNFGFTAGANNDRNHDIQPSITSYDYDAPLTEAGWASAKYILLRDSLIKYSDYPVPAIPDSLPVIEIPRIPFSKTVNLFDVAQSMHPVLSELPLSFEELNQGSGYVLYSRICNEPLNGKLEIPGLRDYALIYQNRKRVAELNRYYNQYSSLVDYAKGDTLDILVENMGRINYGSEILHNTKGIISPITINGRELRGDWKMYPFPFDHRPDLSSFESRNERSQPTILEGVISLDTLGDTFFDMSKFGKGIVFVNGHNMGRYWSLGPQQTLFVPGCWLRKNSNDIMVFEMENNYEYRWITTVKNPILEQLNTRIVKISARYDRIMNRCGVDMACDDGLPADIYYTKDGSDPSLKSLTYTTGFRVESPVSLAAIAYRHGVTSGFISRLSIEPSLSSGKEIKVAQHWSNKYSGGGDYALVDGIHGTDNYKDGYWQGYEGTDLNAVIDLGTETPVKKISVGCLQDIGSWIFLPDSVEFFISQDGKNYSSVEQLTHQTVKEDSKNILAKEFSVEKSGINARFIKVVAKNVGVCPPWHSGAGEKAWLFVDEITVK